MSKKILLAVAVLCAASQAFGAQEIRFWHAMTGAAGAEIDALAARFNASQPEFRVAPSYQGGYDQTLAAALAARGQSSGPHVVQVYDVGTADIMAVKHAVRPLWQVMREAGVSAEAKYLPPVAGYFSDTKGRLLALPFNAATPVLFYNRDALRRASLDPARLPRTWHEMPRLLGALREAGIDCPFTTAWQSWVLLENMSAWHNQRFATQHNGLDGAAPRLAFNSGLMMRWISMLSSWRKAGYFVYSGRGGEAEARFAAGECALLTSSSAAYDTLRGRAPFDFGVAPLPYYDDLAGSPQNTLAGGAALWVMNGRPKAEYRGVARFLAFLSRPDVQAEWQQRTGFVPVSWDAYVIARERGVQNPAQEVAMHQLADKAPTGESRGIRLGRFPRIRAIIDEELEQVWSGAKTPLDALNSAVQRGNAVLERFARNEPEIK